MPASSTHPETLLAQRDFARRLARALLGDHDAAEDVAQQAWLRTREHEAGERWRRLPLVVRSLASRVRRTAARRARREAQFARPEVLPSTADVVAFEATRRAVVNAVLALPEPYRGTVLAVYLDGQTPSRLAQQLGLPAASVRSRLRRGLALLRTALEREHGADWRAVLLPLAFLRGTAGILGATLMTKKLTLSLAGSGLLALGAWVLAPPGVTPAPGPRLDAATRLRAAPLDRGAATPREPLDARATTTASTTTNGGTVRFADGTPAAGLPYWFAAPESSVDRRRAQAPDVDSLPRTDADGGFPEPPAGGAWLWVRVTAGLDVAVDVHPEHHRTEIVLPAMAVVDVDISGTPIEDRVTARLSPCWREADGTLVQAVSSVDRRAIGSHDLFCHRFAVSTQRDASASVRWLAIAGLPYRLSVEGLWSRFDPQPLDVIPPARVQCAPVAVATPWEVRVAEPDGSPSDIAGFAMLRTRYTTHTGTEVTPFSQGRHRIAQTTHRADRTDLTIVLADGESFVPGLPKAASQPIAITRGAGQPPTRLELPPGEWAKLYLVDGSDVTWVPALEASFYQDIGPVRLEQATSWDVIAAPPTWTRAFALGTDGRLAACERAIDGLQLRASPPGPALPPIAPGDLARRYPELQPFWLRFEIQPPGLPADVWLVVDQAPFSATVEREVPPWHLGQTRGVPFRLVIQSPKAEPFILSRWW
ncbi:MAG: sigma factor-like helix-turn-helix DNA-binding protein [Planctomycetota bacterium]